MDATTWQMLITTVGTLLGLIVGGLIAIAAMMVLDQH